MIEKLFCAYCGSTDNLYKRGIRYRKDGTGVQRYICRKCNTARCKAWRATERGKQTRRKLRLKYNGNNPRKVAARVTLNKAIKQGVLLRPELCSDCHKKLKLDAHHPNYDEPLTVVWLCRNCHLGLHRVI